MKDIVLYIEKSINSIEALSSNAELELLSRLIS